ncbi:MULTISPECIES: DUF397 domain-containing protein [Nocardiopsis]|uniref:DUF397 domain-containing protein n=1 Tax=Nocardiopsis alba TaxID=53437 RepID=A0A7K2IQN9_9ACTN|nr:MULTISPECIES: DUF397 domain-containing protein [Nocardiopsis]MEC3892990.1 DUF397 domain-containing protein [Nocardiopsis sp. LDBS1602]MYR32105.1 DUF397 domain-containing protein [Nocardiopsis alba]
MAEHPSLVFHKSSYSTTRQECVEVAEFPAGAAVRDSERPVAGHLVFPAHEWAALLVVVTR